MNNYRKLVERLREGANSNVLDLNDVSEAADAIENLLRDTECRKIIASGLVYLNEKLAEASAEKAEQIQQLEAELRRLNSESFWLCKGD